MRDYRDAKAMATSLRQALSDRQIAVTHSDALELVSKSFGLDNWNILAAKIDDARPALELNGKPTVFCSFCGKSQHEVAKLIAGPDVFICDECVGLCDSIIDETHIAGLVKADRERAAAGDGYPTLTGFLRGQTKEGRAKIVASTKRWLDHMRWSLAETAQALGEPVPPLPPAPPRRKSTPLLGKTHDELVAHKAWLEGELADGLAALKVAEGIGD